MRLTNTTIRSRRLHGNINTTVAIKAIDDIKAEIELMRRPRRRVRRYATVIIMVIAGAGFLIASAHAEEPKQPAEQQQLAGIQRSVSEIYENLTIQTERLQLIELEIAVVQRRCAGIEPRPPTWSEPEHSK
jgi:hypothetical protein